MSVEIAPFRLYVSVDLDLGKERELLGRSLIEIPLDAGWEITYSPRGNSPLKPGKIISADIHIVLMGGDIRAPVGQECFLAMRNGRPLIPLLKTGVNRTPAAVDYVRYLGKHNQWQPYSDFQQLRFIFLSILTSKLVNMASKFRLTKSEFEKLLIWQGEVEQQTKESLGDLRGGAGESSVILSVDRFYPSDGIRLEVTDDGEEGNSGSQID